MMGEWKTFELGELVRIASGGSFPVKYQGIVDAAYNFFKVSDMNLTENKKMMIKSTNTIDDEIKEKLRSKIHPENTIIFPKVGAALLTNKRRILAKPSAFDNNIMGIIPNENVDYKYLYYFMLTVDFGKFSQTGAIPSINNTIVTTIPIDLPIYKSEQQKIAAILSSVDEAIEKTEQIIEQTETVKKGLMQELLTKGIGHTEFKDSSFGRIPVSWVEYKLEDIAEFIRNGFVGTASPYYTDSEDGIYYLMSNNVRKNKLDLNKLVKITKEFHLKQARSQLKEGDLLTVQSGHIGTTAVVPQSFGGHNCHAVIVTTLKEIDVLPDFVSIYLNSFEGEKRLKGLHVGSTIKHINTKDFKKLIIPIPSLDEQSKIVGILQSFDDKIDKEATEMEVLVKIKQGLMQELLTGKKRVKVEASEEVLS